MKTVHSPRSAMSQRWMYCVSFPQRETRCRTSLGLSGRHTAAVGSFGRTDEECVMTTLREHVVASATASWHGIRPVLAQSSATSCRSGYQPTPARYLWPSRRRTASGLGDKLQCRMGHSFLRREYLHRVGWVCRRRTSEWRGTENRQHTRCYPAGSLHSPNLQRTYNMYSKRFITHTRRFTTEQTTVVRIT